MSTLDEQKRLASALSRQRKLNLRECFDSNDPTSRPSSAQQEALDDLGKVQYRWCLGGNQSGKSSLGAREVSWLFQDNHPTWTRPIEWGQGPLLIIVIGRVSQQVETELWGKKIRPLLDPGCYKEIRVGSMLQRAENIHNGNVILFMSHHSEDEAREKAQSYVANYVWLDEMPRSAKLVEELHRRIQSRSGYFLATFTPKVKNEDIRKMVDNARLPYGKKYRFHVFDNPIVTQAMKEQIMFSIETRSESEQATILNGEWSSGDDAVYDFNVDYHVEAPPGYHPSWRHVESVDPALSSKLGLTVWAQSPKNGIWYCIKAEYIEGIKIPTDLIKEVIAQTENYNIIRRICDPSANWYIGQASSMGRHYMGVVNKNSRKEELIKNLQEALGPIIKLAPWCDKLIAEFTTCSWADGTQTDRIVNSSRFHLLDAAQYFVDGRPRDFKPQQEILDPFIELRKKAVEQQAQKSTKEGSMKKWRMTSRRWR